MKRLRGRPLPTSLTEIDQLTTKELYLIAALIANKYLIDEGEDEQVFNSEAAQLTGITTDRINFIERQVLSAFNWDLYVSREEFEGFFSLFKNHLKRKLNQPIEIEDPTKFYQLCLQSLPQIIEYLALASIVLLGSTISILTAVHLGLLTHSTLMKTFSPDMHCREISTCPWNMPLHKPINRSLNEANDSSHFQQLSWRFPIDFTANETKDSSISVNKVFDLSACSIDLLQPHTISRSLVHTFG